MSVLKITNANFDEEVINSDVPVLVDFWAPWCGPCRMLGPIVDEIADEAKDFKVGKVNVDDETDLAVRFGVQSIPTLLVFEKGEVKANSLGVTTKEAILGMISK